VLRRSASSSIFVLRQEPPLIDQGHFEEAERLLAEEAGLLEARYVTRSLEIARSLGTWGRLRRAQGRLDEASARYRESLEMFTAFLGPTHLATTRAQVRYGECLLASGDHAGGRDALVRALVIQVRAFGADHPDAKRTAALVNSLPFP
jgi:hypothetical protein